MLKRQRLILRAAAVFCAFALPTAAGALSIEPFSLTVSRSVDSGVSWWGVSCTGTTTVFVGDWIAISLTLVNDTGLLGNMLTNDNPGAPQPGNTIDIPFWLNGDFYGTNNGLDIGSPPEMQPWRDANLGPNMFWPGQYWIWPLQGACPSPGCINDVYPARFDSPVSLVPGGSDDVTDFNYNLQWINRTDMWDGAAWTQLGNMPRLRGWHAVVTDSGLLYTIGGRNAGGLVAEVDVFDMSAQVWLPPLANNLPTPRDRLAAAVAGGKIYVFGGQDGAGNPVDTVEIYDIGSGTWDPPGGPLNHARYGLTATFNPGDGMIYVMGGYNAADGGETGWIEQYDPTGAGTANDLGWLMAIPRFGHAAVFNPPDGLIYVLGGFEINGNYCGCGTPTSLPAVESFDPGSFTPSYPPTAGFMDLFQPAGDIAAAQVGIYMHAVGGRDEGFFGFGSPPYRTVIDNQQIDPAGGPAVTPMSPLNPKRSRAAAGSDGVNLFVTGGYGMEYLNAGANGGTNETQRVTWIYKMETEWPLPSTPGGSLDFKILAIDQDDGNGYDDTGDQWEGSGLDCNTCGDLNVISTPTLTNILQDECGGRIVVVSPLQAVSSATIMDPGGRPPDTAWIGDTLQVRTDVVNQGLTVTIAGSQACSVAQKTGTFCLSPLGAIGGCSGGPPQPYEPVSPVLPFTITPGGSATVVWSYSALGAGCALDSCGGSGTLFWEMILAGARLSTGTLYVTPAPLVITATLWVDPDGAGVAYAPMPLGEIVPGIIGPFYYMGKETLSASFIFTNTSALYSVDFEPTVNQTLPGDIITLAGPLPAGSLTLGPGESATVSWTFARAPTSIFDSCLPGGLGGINFLGITAAARGVCAVATVELHPVPFEPFDICAGACPIGTGSLSFTAPAAPANAAVGSPYLVSLNVRNVDNRPFVINAPSASLFIDVVPSGGATFTLGPPPTFGTGAWAAGEIRTFSWQVTPLSIGSVDTTAGIDYGQFASPPCLRGCNEVGAPGYCRNLVINTPFVIPGQVAITDVRVSTTVMCEDGATLLAVAWDITNTSSTDIFTAMHYGLNGYPEADVPTDTGNVQLATIPTPVDPPTLVIPPLTTMTVTFYMNAYCGVVRPGVYNATTHWVDGIFTDSIGVVTNCCDFANWGGSIPTVAVTKPADLSEAAIWTDALEYSVGQRIRLFFSVSNAGGNDLTDFQMGIGYTVLTQNPQLALAPGTWPTPTNPWTYTGSGICAAPAPYNANQTFEWNFDVVQAPGTVAVGTFFFTATAGGYDAGCGGRKNSNIVVSPVVRIANSAQLVCKAEATPLVTMAVACATCTPMSTCDQQTGIGCINVTMVSSNFGDIEIVNATPSSGIAAAYLASCDPVQCATAFAIPVSVPPEAASGTGIIPKVTSVTYAWTYSPTGLGCVRMMTTFSGEDGATGASLYCDQWTNCVNVLPRYPLELSLVTVPSEVSPGQTFNVGVKVCNPGGTSAGLQGGEPALQFFQVATGGKVTEQYDVTPPLPVVLAPDECQTIQVTVTVHKNADPGAIEIRVPQGDRFIARDAATGLAFPAVDRGGPLAMQVKDLRNLLEISGANPTRLSAAGGKVLITYQIADAGSAGQRTTRLKVYTLNGELVRTLVDKQAVAERADVPWDGRNEDGQVVASGVYIVRLEGPAYSAVKKLAIVK